MDSGSGSSTKSKPSALQIPPVVASSHPASKRTFLYTPFGGTHALDAALGENMVRVEKGKQAHPLIAPSHVEANRLETLRQETLATWKGTLDAADQTLKTHHNKTVTSGYTQKMRMRQIAHDKSLNTQQRDQAMRQEKRAHAIRTFEPTDVLMAKADKALYPTKYRALEQTEIANATVNVKVTDTPAHPRWPSLFPAKREVVTAPKLYPSLYSDERPLENLDKRDKLYVLGHGAPVSEDVPHPGIYAKPTIGNSASLSPGGLAQHFSDKGLTKDFEDLRLTACQSVPLLKDSSLDSVTQARGSGFLAPELSKAAKPLFPKLHVTGYMGNGVTFPFGSDHHLRASPSDAMDRVPRKQLAVKFPPL